MSFSFFNKDRVTDEPQRTENNISIKVNDRVLMHIREKNRLELEKELKAQSVSGSNVECACKT